MVEMEFLLAARLLGCSKLDFVNFSKKLMLGILKIVLPVRLVLNLH